MIAFIAPLLALYVKYRVIAYALKFTLFLAIFVLFKTTMEWSIATVVSMIDAISLPCTFMHILSVLEIFSMINFALSFYATIYIGRFFFNSVVKLV